MEELADVSGRLSRLSSAAPSPSRVCGSGGNTPARSPIRICKQNGMTTAFELGQDNFLVQPSNGFPIFFTRKINLTSASEHN